MLENLKGIINYLEDAVFIHLINENGEAGELVEVNDYACKLLGYSKTELLSLFSFSSERKLNISILTVKIRAGSNNDPERYEGFILHNSGKQMSFRFRSYYDKWEGKDCIVTIGRDLGCQKETGCFMRDSYYELESLLNKSEFFIFILDKTGKIINLNKYGLERLGYDMQDLTGMHKSLLHPESEKAKIDSIYEKVTFYAENIINTSLVTRNGVQIPVQSRIFPGTWMGTEVLILVAWDISENVQLKQETVDSRKKLENRLAFEQVLSEISTSFINIDDVTINQRFQAALKCLGEFLGVDRAYIFQLRDYDFMEFTHEWVAENISKANMIGFKTAEYPWLMKNMGEFKSINAIDIKKDLPEEAAIEKIVRMAYGVKSFLIVPIHLKNTLMGFIGFDSIKKEKVWDESDIRMLKAVAVNLAMALESVNSIKELIIARDKAEESNRLKSAFLATINHELRTPLNHIIGFSDLLHGISVSKDQVEFAELIHNSGLHLLGLIEDIFSLALVEKGAVNIRQDTFTGMDIFTENKKLLEDILYHSGKNDKIRLRYSPDRSLLLKMLVADRSKINMVMNQLLRNAVKFTEEGFIEFGFYKDDNSSVSFYVSDTGIGISDELKEYVFDFFRQGEDSYSRRHEGLGIGLAIAKRVSVAMKGNLDLESKPGVGSLFTLRVPVLIEDEESFHNYLQADIA